MFDSALYLCPARDVKVEKRMDVCAQGKGEKLRYRARTINNYTSCIMSRPKASHTLTPARAPGVRVCLRHCTTCAQYIVLIKMCESTVVLLAIAEPSSRKTLENPGKLSPMSRKIFKSGWQVCILGINHTIGGFRLRMNTRY